MKNSKYINLNQINFLELFEEEGEEYGLSRSNNYKQQNSKHMGSEDLESLDDKQPRRDELHEKVLSGGVVSHDWRASGERKRDDASGLESSRSSRTHGNQLVTDFSDKKDNEYRYSANVEKKLVEISLKEVYSLTEQDASFHFLDRKSKARNSIEAVSLAKKLQRDNLDPTREEHSILAKYIGFGGVPQLFDSNNKEYNQLYSKLKELVSKEEYSSLKASTSDSFYTNKILIDSTYKILEKAGFLNKTGLNILEPSCGSGNYIGYMPQNFRDNNRVHGIELDPIASLIAEKLYARSESDKKSIIIKNQAFQELDHNNNKFDIVVGNFPFGNQVIFDKYSSNGSGRKLHDYFLAKSIESLNDKGLIVAITSSQFLNHKDSAFKQTIDKKADFIGAIRLPKEAFKNANTEFLCDIVIFQKNENKIIDKAVYENEKHWTNIDLVNNFNVENEHYFVKRIGEVSIETNRFGREFFNFSEDFNNLGNKLNEVIENNIKDISKGFHVQEDIVSSKIIDVELEEDVFIGEYFITSNNEIAQRITDSLSNKRGLVLDIPELKKPKYRDCIQIKETIKHLLNAEIQDTNEKEIFELRKQLNIEYKSFLSSYGSFHDKDTKSILLNDTKGNLVLALEIKDSKGRIITADILSRRLIKNRVATIINVKDALYYSVAKKGHIDLDFISNIKELGLKGDTKALVKNIEDKNLGYLNPKTSQWELAEQYLSGNIVDKKLEINNYLGSYNLDRNLKALDSVTPKRIPFNDIGINFNASWIPLEYKKDFINNTLTNSGDCVETLEYEAITARYGVKLIDYKCTSSNNYQEYGTRKLSACEIITKILKNQSIVVKDSVYENGNIVKQVNHEETELALDKAVVLMQKFYDDISSDPIKSKKLEDIYNETFNSYVAPNYKNGDQLTFPDSNNAITLRPHQKQAVLRGILEDRYLLDHVVGAGKTYTMIATIMERKRLGLNNKPMLVVPNHLVGQWSESFKNLYPNSNILFVDDKNFTKEKREKFILNMALNNWDCVIMSHSSFEKIELESSYVKRCMEKELATISDVLEQVLDSNDKKPSFTVKQLKKTKDAYRSKIYKIANDGNKDSVLTFNKIGVDELYIDESHEFKNLQFHTTQGEIAGINPYGSNKAYDLFMKCQYIQEKKQELTGKESRGVFFATGTPISNSLAELYSISRYLDSSTLYDLGISHFDSWSATFANVKEEWQVSSTGVGFERKKIFSEFKNIPELSQFYVQFADVIQNDDIKDYIKLPRIFNDKAHNLLVEPTFEQKEFMKSIVTRMKLVKNRTIDPRLDNPLKICGDGRKSSIDMRVVDSKYQPCNKVLKLTNEIKSLYKRWEDDKGTQLVFCDISTPKKKSKKGIIEEKEEFIGGNLVGVELNINYNFSIYQDLKERLIQEGIKKEEIAFIHDFNGNDKKDELFKRMNSGDIRVLIGSSQKMGAGMNVQERLVGLHHLDAPWRPTDLEQREGRIIRQGNKLLEKYGDKFKVTINRYATEKMYDSRLWQILENKANFIQQFRTGNIKTRSGEDISGNDIAVKSAEEMKAIASGNPYLMLYVKLKAEYKKQNLIYNRNLENRKIQSKFIVDFEKGEHKEYNEYTRIYYNLKNLQMNKNYNFNIIRVEGGTAIQEMNSKIVLYNGKDTLTDLQIKNRKDKFPEILEKEVSKITEYQNKLVANIDNSKEILKKSLSNQKLLTLQVDLENCKNVLEQFEQDSKSYFIPKSQGFEKEIEQINSIFNKKSSTIMER